VGYGYGGYYGPYLRWRLLRALSAGRRGAAGLKKQEGVGFVEGNIRTLPILFFLFPLADHLLREKIPISLFSNS